MEHWLAATNALSDVLQVLGLGALLLLYLVPVILGFSLNVHHLRYLFLANALIGWTIIGWIGCLIWAIWMSQESATFDDDSRE